MTFAEFLRTPHPELEQIAAEAERQREIDEEIAWEIYATPEQKGTIKK